MLKKVLAFIVGGLLLVNICGCFALFVGAAAGGGTAVWLSGKMSQEVNVPLNRAVQACESALQSLKLEVTKKTVEQDVAQIMSKYTDGKTIWIDVHWITPQSSKIDVRVGSVKPDKQAADKILEEIKRHL
jgi:hypothetical protein